MKPTLPLRRGRLRKSQLQDLDAVLCLLHRESVRRYLCDGQCLSRDSVEEMLSRSDRLDTEGLGLWTVNQEDGGLVGIVGLEPVSAEASVSPLMKGGIEPIIALAPELVGSGLATECLLAVILYAQGTLCLERLVAAVDEPNLRSHALMRRVGFSVMGMSSGPSNDLVLYSKSLTDTHAPTHGEDTNSSP